jgi:hypothetical protein
MRTSATVRSTTIAFAALCFYAVLHAGLVVAERGRAHADQEADPAAEALASGKALFEEQEYKRAVRTLSALVDDRSATPTLRVQALELVALSHVILGQEKRGEETFWRLLEIDPRHELSQDFEASKIREVFQRVREQFFLVGLAHEAPARTTAGDPLEFEAEVTKGDALVKGVTLLARKQGEPVYAPARFRRGGGNVWSLRWPVPPSTSAYVLEYYLEAQDVGGRLIGLQGNPSAPLALQVAAGGVEPAPRSTPWYRRWYTYAGSGFLVGAGTVLLITAIR